MMLEVASKKTSSMFFFGGEVKQLRPCLLCFQIKDI